MKDSLWCWLDVVGFCLEFMRLCRIWAGIDYFDYGLFDYLTYQLLLLNSLHFQSDPRFVVVQEPSTHTLAFTAQAPNTNATRGLLPRNLGWAILWWDARDTPEISRSQEVFHQEAWKKRRSEASHISDVFVKPPVNKNPQAMYLKRRRS